MTKDEYKQRVTNAINKYFSKATCPVCGLQYWNGSIHAESGKFISEPKEQIWCNGKTKFKGRQKETDKA